ncbi:MAG: FecCD family ABC transporter permease [Actinomycetaceae bacterium]
MTAAPLTSAHLRSSSSVRTRVFVLVAVPLLCLLAVVALGVGTSWLTPGEVVTTLLGGGTDAQRQIVLDLRIPRVVLAMLAGAMLATAGAILQTVTRNDLADPSLLGVTSGAALAIVGLQVVDPSVAGWPVPVAGMVGATAAGALVTWLGRGVDRTRFLLQGVLVGAALSAVLSVLVSLRGDLLGTALRWIVGSLSARTWSDVLTLVPWALVGLVLTLAGSRAATLLWLGRDTAGGLGVHLERARALTLLAALALCAGAVAAVGAIGFVGLLGPHLARALVGAHPSRVIGASALLGAVLLLGADTIAQLARLLPLTAGGRTPLPAGAVTAVLGGPLLLVLLARRGGGRR